MANNSINVNVGAMVALQNLNASNRELAVTQNRVSTGLAVSSAKDNGAIFAIATNQRAELGSLNAVRQSLQRGQSIVDVALAAGDTVVEALTEMKSLAVAIEAGGSAATVTALTNDYTARQAEINAALAGADFDGANLWTDGAVTGVLIDTAGTDYNIGFATAVTATPATMTAAGVQATIESFTASLATIGTQSKSLERYTTFNSKMQDAVENGIGNLVDADLAKESARLTALQTKQQLGVQSLSIANSSSQILLSLFRS